MNAQQKRAYNRALEVAIDALERAPELDTFYDGSIATDEIAIVIEACKRLEQELKRKLIRLAP